MFVRSFHPISYTTFFFLANFRLLLTSSSETCDPKSNSIEDMGPANYASLLIEFQILVLAQLLS